MTYFDVFEWFRWVLRETLRGHQSDVSLDEVPVNLIDCLKGKFVFPFLKFTLLETLHDICCAIVTGRKLFVGIEVDL